MDASWAAITPDPYGSEIIVVALARTALCVAARRLDPWSARAAQSAS